MILSIENHQKIHEKELIGIFDIRVLKNSEENKELMKDWKEEERESNTWIVGEKTNFFSNIAVATIQKRWNASY